MNRELQDKVWSVLPKEFKEEVKKMRLGEHYIEEQIVMIRLLFGDHNLNTDDKGEEMLTVPKSKAQKLYSDYCAERDKEEPGSNRSSLGGRIAVLEELFGSKCLPDEERGFFMSVKSPFQGKTVKQELTIEQSVKLVNNGINPSKASRFEIPGGIGPNKGGLIPIFTLADLFSLLPRKIRDGYDLEIVSGKDGWEIYYNGYTEEDPTYICSGKELIDALYSALLWCIDNNHVKLD